MQAEQTLGLPPQRPKKAPASTRARPPLNPNVLFDQHRQKREEISQFLEQNGANDLSTIMSNQNVTMQMGQLQHQNSSGLFNKTEMRIYQELFPERLLKA